MKKLQEKADAPVQTPIRASDKIAAIDKMAKIAGIYKTDKQPQAAPITQITVILNHGTGGRTTETHQLDTPEPLPPGTVDGQVLGVDAHDAPDAAAGAGDQPPF